VGKPGPQSLKSIRLTFEVDVVSTAESISSSPRALPLTSMRGNSLGIDARIKSQCGN